MSLVSINLDENQIREMVREKLADALKEVDIDMVFWDSKELMRRTCMCWNTIQKTFFFDPRFPKRKVGRNWYFPARETRKFLEQWLDEQGRGAKTG